MRFSAVTVAAIATATLSITIAACQPQAMPVRSSVSHANATSPASVIANRLGAVEFQDFGAMPSLSIVSSGIAILGTTKIGIVIFSSVTARNSWIRTFSKAGISFSHDGSTWAAYDLGHQLPPGVVA